MPSYAPGQPFGSGPNPARSSSSGRDAGLLAERNQPILALWESKIVGKVGLIRKYHRKLWEMLVSMSFQLGKIIDKVVNVPMTLSLKLVPKMVIRYNIWANYNNSLT